MRSFIDELRFLLSCMLPREDLTFGIVNSFIRYISNDKIDWNRYDKLEKY